MSRRKTKILVDFFRNPTVGIFGSIASILGLGLAVFFYIDSNEIRELTVFEYPVKSILTDIDSDSDFTIYYQDSIIEGEVTSAQIAFWNNGELPIKRENVLKELQFLVENNVQILNAKILQQTREVINLKIINDSFNIGKVIFDWDILEQNDGAVIQITYNDNKETKINYDAVIEKQKTLRVLKHSQHIKNENEQYSSQKLNKSKFLSILALALIILITHGIRLYFRKKNGAKIYQKHDILLVINGVVIIAFLVYHYINNSGLVSSPFTF